MKTILRTYKFELEPTKEQATLLDKHFGCARYVYNRFLNQRMEQYRADKTSDSYHAQCKTLVAIKKEEATQWLKEVNSQSLQFALKCLEAAYLSFFRGNTKFPSFKSKRGRNSFTAPQHTSVVGGRVFAPKFKSGIKCNIHREITGEIGKMTFSKTSTGKYFVSISTEENYAPMPKTGQVCGVDLGIKDFAVTSNGVRYKNNRYTKRYERDLAKAQRHLARKQKGSSSSERQRRKVARIHEKAANSRNDTLHKVSHEMVRDFDIICIEDLNIKGLIANGNLSKHIADASWGTFVKYLEYKAIWNGKKVIKINRWFPSSKMCSECGRVNQGLTLGDRVWKCNCVVIHDRDINAAKNILAEGLKIISAGTVDYTGGAEIRPYGAQALKPEALPIDSVVGEQFTSRLKDR